jgi:hypothetical protein
MQYQNNNVNEVTTDLSAELQNIKEDIKKYGVFSFLFKKLSERRDVLQNKLDEIANKKGILTKEELYDAQILAATSKAQALKNENKKTVRNGIMYISGFVVVIFGVWYFTIKKK